MLKILRDPIWQSIGALVGLLGILLMAVFGFPTLLYFLETHPEVYLRLLPYWGLVQKSWPRVLVVLFVGAVVATLLVPRTRRWIVGKLKPVGRGLKRLCVRLNRYLVIRLAKYDPGLTVSIKADDPIYGHLHVTRAGLVIHTATYGTQAESTDVAGILKSRVKDGKLELVVANDNLGGDPAYGEKKTLNVTYTYSGERYSVTADEWDTLSLP